MIRKFFLALSCSIATASLWGHATVTPLPGTTPQTAPVGEVFPNPIRLLVTDNAGSPVPGATVGWEFPPSGYSRLWIHDGFPFPCVREPFGMGPYCRYTAGADGIVEIHGLYGTVAGTHVLSVTAGSGQTFLGNAELEFRVELRQPPLQVVSVAADTRRAVIGTAIEERFAVRVLSAQGAPVAGAIVNFTPYSHGDSQRGFAVDPARPWSITDADGYAIAPPFLAGWVPGVHAAEAAVDDAQAGTRVRIPFTVTVTNARGEMDLDLTNLWWSGPVENGWGMSIVKHGAQLFNVLFVYDAQGKPTWYVQPGGSWGDGVGSIFGGGVYSPRSAPWFAYDASRFAVGEPIGWMGTEFFGPSRARFNFGVYRFPLSQMIVTKEVITQDFTGETPSPIQGVADMWWGGPEQNGWGVAILEQFGNLFAVWFTYDAEGKPTWFVMPGGQWRDATTYSGTMYRTSGSPWVGREYDASQLRVGAVGPYTLKFLDKNRAMLEISVDGVARSLPITRQPF
jgi:hypothetical protein